MLTDRDLAKLKRYFKEWIREVIDESRDEPITARQAADIYGYKSTAVILQYAEFFGGTQKTKGGKWTFSRLNIERMHRQGIRPTVEIQHRARVLNS